MSFGSGGFGGFGQQNNTTTGFGGFGATNNTTTTTGGFGTNTTAFGAAQNTGAGLFGNTGNAFGASTGGFGSTGTGTFGAKPAFGATTTTSGGLFGSTTATAGGSAFGAGGFGTTANTAASSPFGGGGTTSLFGGQAKPAFGATTGSTSLFGGSSTTPAFGAGATTGFGATANPGIGTNVGDPPGTALVAFQPYLEKEATTNQQNSFQNILFMDAYRKWSPEELRLADYNQGRRYGNASGAGTFGVGSNFGGFGANNATATGSTGNLFGSTATTGGTAFGGTTAGSFGSTPASGGLFGAKPAATTGLFGAQAAAQPAQTGNLFGTNAGGFGANAGTTGSLFGNTANQNKPATGFGLGTGGQTNAFGTTGTTGFGAANTGAGATGATGGLFGTPAAATTTGGGLFGTGAQATPAAGTTPFGASTGGAFGTQSHTTGGLFGQPKPATGGLFGASTGANPGATTGGLFANAASPFGGTTAAQTGGLFGNKPATTTTTGGLFSGGLGQPAAATGAGTSLFGLGQPAQVQQQPQQGQSLFGNSLGQTQAKPSLFGTAAPAAGGGYFGNPGAATQQTGGLFGQSTAVAQPQAAGLGGSFLGASQQGAGLGVSQGLTTSINDAGAYGAPSLFQGLASQEIQNPGPLATPLSGNKTKTSRRSSILPIYKMNPGSASKFATPQKRGYGFSYSTFGTPNSVSSTASTPGIMSQSLLVGSVGRSGLTKSISSSNLRRTYNPEDSILLPGAFSTNSGSRFYGSTGSSRKLVINRDMRTDLFSTPSKTTEPADLSSDNTNNQGTARRLTKRVSFDTTLGKDVAPPAVNGSSSARGTEPEAANQRPQTRSTNGTGASSRIGNTSSSATTAAAAVAPKDSNAEPVTGMELAIVHEEESLPARARCIPNDYQVRGRDLGEYWMSPSKDEIRAMSHEQRQRVVNFTVGRMNVGQVRFRVPVNLDNIDLDNILGGLVILERRSCTVYPEQNTKPPVGQGLNVPAEILLLHTYPRDWPNVSPEKMHKHLRSLKRAVDTTFVSYDEKTAAWLFEVMHFTTYGIDDDDDEKDETDAEVTGITASTALTTTNNTLPGFRRRRHISLPGAFDSNESLTDDDEEEYETHEQSFLSSGSADKSSRAAVPIELMQHDDEMELGEGGGLYDSEGEAPRLTQHDPAAEPNNDSPEYPQNLPPAITETPAGIMRARLRAIKEANTPMKVQVADGDNWMEMLQKTVSPQKRDRVALKTLGEHGAFVDAVKESPTKLDKKAATPRRRNMNDNHGFATSIDLMNSLFEKAKAPTAETSDAITLSKGFVKWPSKRPDKTAADGTAVEAEEEDFRDTVRPSWSTDGAFIVAETHGQANDTSEPALKRIRVYDALGATFADDRFENGADHKDVVDVQVVDGVPAASTRRIPHIKTFAGFCEQVNRRRSATASALSQQLGAYEQSVWELASVLFDPLEEQASSPADGTRRRREMLATFWSQIVRDSTTAKQVDQAQSAEEKAVLHLASRKTPEACRSLIDGKDLKLATLVSLIGTSDSFKGDMREQIDEWKQGDVLAEFDVPLRALYSMLAGNVAVCEGKKGSGVENRMDTVVLSRYFGLDWKQAFGLRLWYGIAAGEGIEAAVAQYVEDLEQGRVPTPRPWYSTQRDIPIAWSDPQREQREDLMFGLLKVAAGLASLEDVLEPENSQPLPFRFQFCWQINQALSAVEGIAATAKLPKAKADALTSAYASEVVCHNDRIADGRDGAWVHAIWVLLHLSDPVARTRAIQDVLGRHAGSLFASNGAQAHLYDVLVDELQIPTQWVWQAAALYWRSQQNQPVLEAECLLRASAYSDAHHIFVKQLAPKAIVERNYGEISEMLEKLQPHSQHIKDWVLGGEVYSRFLDLLTLQRGGTLSRGNSGVSTGAASRTRSRQQQARDDADQASGQLTAAVEALASSLPAMYDSVGDAMPTEIAAITEMADVVAKETMALADKGRMDLTKISRLPLTEDRRVRYSSDLAFTYYREVMGVH